MKYTQTAIEGAYVVEMEPIEDERGIFARSWCQKEFTDHGLNPKIVQCNVSFNKKKGTLRGMHYQIAPFEEAKLVRATRGAIYDVIVDIRPKSPTFKKWFGIELASGNFKMLYVPKGIAHGFETLKDNTEVFYQMSEFYSPGHARGIRWDDPSFAIDWPGGDKTISAKDLQYSDFHI